MKSFSAWNNRLTGTVDLTKLPTTIQYLYLDGNKFDGSVTIYNVPQSLQYLDLHNNNIVQDELCIIGKLPNGLQSIRLSGNKIHRIVDAEGNIIEDDRIKY